jgi:two-component system, OmpR family, sensor histidine kinase TctE
MSSPATISGEDVARAVHDIASPLTVLVGLCFALRRRVDDAAVIAVIERVEGEVGRVSDRLDTLLRLGRHDPMSRRPTCGRVSLAGLAHDVAARCSAVADLAGARVLVEVGHNALVIHGDAAALETALENVVGNAVRHAGSEGTVWVSASAWGGQAVLHIADNGPGVHPSDRAHIFRPHVRGRGTTGRGQGLGLAITRDTVVRHGGEIVLEPSLRGAVFRITLPLAASAAAHRESDAA